MLLVRTTMDLTFLPLPNDVCYIISAMKAKMELAPIMEELLEREKKTYKFRKDCRIQRGDETVYHPMESLEFPYTGQLEKLRADDTRRKWSYMVGNRTGNIKAAGKFYTTNNVLLHFQNLKTVADMKAHLRDNNVKGYSKLRKDELKALCLSF